MEKQNENNGKNDKQEVGETAKPARLKIAEKVSTETHREYLDMDTDEEEFGKQETPEPLEETPPEPDKPVFTDAELNTLVKHTQELTILPNLLESDWNEECCKVARDYFSDPSKTILCIYFVDNELCASFDFPLYTDNGLTYFLRDTWQVYNVDNFMSSVIFGSINERIENVVLKYTDGIYAPFLFKNVKWRFKKNEIFSNLHNFLTRAIEATYKPMGILILYVPWEGTLQKQDNHQSIEIQSESTEIKRYREIIERINDEEEEELINRLEIITKYWIKQIRNILSITPILSDELHDLNSEFKFWQIKYENLECIIKQLETNRVSLIIKRLKSVKSPSVKKLKELVKTVKNSLEEAKSNLIYLDIILENCKILNDPKELQNSLPKILHVMRFVWTESSYYNSTKNIERLLCSLSVYVIKVCANSVDVKSIFDDPKACREILKTNLLCCKFYSKMYDNIIEKSTINQENWQVNKETIFKYISVFEQRCRDVSEICDSIIIYGSLNKINLGGTKGNQHEMRYRRIKNYFVQIMNEMKVCCNYALDITKSKWLEDITDFRNNVTEIENNIKNLLNNLFDDVKTIEMGIETLYSLMKFKERREFQDILQKKWMQVWELFYEEIKICALASKEYEVIQDQLKLQQSESSLKLLIYKKYLTRMNNIMINASDWLGDCELKFEVPSKYLTSK